jgi:hypothetical protein
VVTFRRLWYRFVDLDHLGGKICASSIWMNLRMLLDNHSPLNLEDSTTDLDGERLAQNV